MLNCSHQRSRFAAFTFAITMALASTGRVSAQTTPSTEASAEVSEIVVTATRLDKAGFDAPTPTTVLSAEEIAAASRVSIGEVLADQPQFRAENTPARSNGSTNSSATVNDLRGLGQERTLTLFDGHRFVGANDLNTVQQNIIQRVDVVTGGASAAWGSGAVAGVVNLIPNDNLQGLTIGATGGISSRGDGDRFGVDLTFGDKFADGKGHFLFAGAYFRDQGLFGRCGGSRPNVCANEFATNSGQLFLIDNVKPTTAAPGGLITSGPLAGMQFNPDGSLSPLPLGNPTNSNSTVGGAGSNGLENAVVAAPFHRANAYTRVTYEVSDALKLSADINAAMMWDNFYSSPEEIDGSTTMGLAFQKDNPFLTPAVQAQLASGPQTFNFGRLFVDQGYEALKYYRKTIEFSVGASGHIGGSWSYSAYADHGEIRQSQGYYNQIITANFNNAIDAVRGPAGNIVCRVALTDPNTPCRPLNLFGVGNASAAAIAYAYATNPDQVNLTQTQSLTAAGGSIRGDLFNTWAGPVSTASGVDYRKEELELNNIDPLSASGALGGFNNSGTAGKFDVWEAFFEGEMPLLNNEHVAKIDLNGAARFSDYSTSGSIWSWKYGGTARLIDDILLRTVYSRDIRSPNIQELFTAHSQQILTITDPLNNNVSYPVSNFSGGNTALNPELSHTLTIGGSYSPHYIPGLSMSLDYYHIIIKGAIDTLSSQDIINLCAQGNQALCNQITRGSNGLITQINSTYLNLDSYDTHGVDAEIAYSMPLSRLLPNAPGTIKLRSLTSYVPTLVINTGVSTVDRAGDVGDFVCFSACTPKWRSNLTLSYDDTTYGGDARLRYVGGGNWDSLQPIVNNYLAARTYLDLGAHMNVGILTLTANIQNVFNRSPPFVLYASNFYDVWGTYFTLGFKVKVL
jgi:iron complex outermembrane recepter protein